MTPLGKSSTQAAKYLDSLLAEYLAGTSLGNNLDTYWTRRGKRLEPEARKLYEFISDEEVIQVGFCTLDDGTAGCSPDGLTKEGLLEIKCPKPETMISYYRNGFSLAYKPQVQGQLWVTERPYCDFFAYHPKMKPFTLRVERDEVYINALFSEVASFNIKLAEAKEELEEWRV